jgi:hypothetical protein
MDEVGMLGILAQKQPSRSGYYANGASAVQMISCSSQTPVAWPLSTKQYARSLPFSQLFKFAEPLLN